MANTKPVLHDALIIGGGPAGLAAALSLSRQLRTAVLFDSGLYRNARATHMHNVLGFDHAPPASYRAKGRSELTSRYATTTIVDREVVSLAQHAPGIFKAVDAASETHYARRVVLATGVTDILPTSIPGFADCWGRTVFHCLFCHGYEERGAPSAGVLTGGAASSSAMAMHVGNMARTLAETVTIYTNGDAVMADEVASIAPNPPFQIDPRRITRLENLPNNAGVTLYFESGPAATERFLSHMPPTRVNGPFAEQLGLETTEAGDIKVKEPFKETSVPGVYATGDCASMIKSVGLATASSTLVAAGVAHSLGGEPRPELVV